MLKFILLLLTLCSQLHLTAGNCCSGCLQNNQFANYRRIPEAVPMQELAHQNQTPTIPPMTRAKIIRKGPDFGNPTNLPIATTVPNATITIAASELIHSHEHDVNNQRIRTLAVIQSEQNRQENSSNNQLGITIQFANNNQSARYYYFNNIPLR